MMKPRILFACRIADAAARERIQDVCDIVEVETADPGELATHVGDVTGIIVPFTPAPVITREVMEAAPNLRLVGTTYGGVRQNVDYTYALSKGLTVIHTGASRVKPMAEYTLALILSSLLRFIITIITCARAKRGRAPSIRVPACCKGDPWG